MATYYIDPTGNNTTGDGSIGSPWATISKFFTSAADGDKLIMLEGTYTGEPNLSLPVISLTIEAEKDADGLYKNIIIDGTGVSTSFSAQNGGDSSLTFKGVSFQNIDTTVGKLALFNDVITDNSLTTVWIAEDCKFENVTNSEGIISSRGFGQQKNVSFKRCLFNNVRRSVGAGAGDEMFIGDQFTLENCTIYFDEASDYYTNVFNINGNLTTDFVTIKNNIVMDNQSVIAFGTASSSGTNTITYNCFHQISSPPGGTGEITSDPLFVDAANGNFNLRLTSPCINTGTLI